MKSLTRTRITEIAVKITLGPFRPGYSLMICLILPDQFILGTKTLLMRFIALVLSGIIFIMTFGRGLVNLSLSFHAGAKGATILDIRDSHGVKYFSLKTATLSLSF